MTSQTVSPRLVTVEPVFFLINAIQGVLINLRTEYIETRLAEKYNYTLPNLGAENSTCGLNETSNSTSNDIVRTIQAETALWVLYLKDTSVFIPMFTATILAAASDFIGRRPIFLIGAVCHLVGASGFLFVSIFNLPLPVLVGAEAILGFGGDTVATESVAFAYIIDTYHVKKRRFRLVLASTLRFMGFGISQIAIGGLLQFTKNFNVSFLCAVVIAIVHLLYVCIPYFIPETRSREQIPKNMLKEMFLNYFRLFKKDRGWNRLRLVTNLVGEFVYILVHEAVFIVITIYAIADPFCWTPTETGIYAVMVNMFPALCSVVGVKLLSVFLNNFWILHTSFASAIGEILVTAWAQTSAVILYAAPCIGFLRTLAHPIYKAQISQLVKPDEQGVLFGCQAFVSSVGKVCSPLVLNTSYARFVTIGQPEKTFFVAAGLLGIPVLLNGLLQICTSGKDYSPFVDESEGNTTATNNYDTTEHT